MRLSVRLFFLILSTLLLASCAASCGDGGAEPAGNSEASAPASDPAAQSSQASEPATEAEADDPPAETATSDEESGPAAGNVSADVPGETMTDAAALLRDPSLATERAPDNFKARFETTKGDFVVEVDRDWSPRGADRFYNLVKAGFFNEVAFFRVLTGFVAQFGIHGDPQISSAWRQAPIEDDPVTLGNERGTIVFATAGANTRTTQLFINLVDNRQALDNQGFSAFGKVVDGMEVVDQLYAGYGEGAPRGRGPDQGQILARGNDYLKSEFPQLDFVVEAEIVE